MMIKSNTLLSYLNTLFPNAKTELNYQKDYELLIAVILSAQSTDKRVNQVTSQLFKYNLLEISNLPTKNIETIIRSVGTYKRKAEYIKITTQRLINEQKGFVPNDRHFLESLPGVGRKTSNVVLAILYQVPSIAVDTHVTRVSTRLGIVLNNDNVNIIEEKLMKFIPKNNWINFHHQLVLFGRYLCKSQKPKCKECLLKNECIYYTKKKQ